MAVQQITATDINSWNSLEDIATSFEKRGLKPLPDISDDNRLVLELADGEFIELVQAGTGKSATDYKPGSVTRHTNLVATDDYETFTFITRVRDWDAHGRIKYQQFSFEKDQFRRDSGEKHTVLQKLNEIEYGQSASVMDDLYDTRQIVKEFYEQFESLRTDLVQEVSGIPDDRGDAKQRYVQVLLDRMIFLYFIQEKNLLDYDAKYLHNHHEDIVSKAGDVYENFYDPLFFDLLAEGKNDPEFGKLPYLNGGLFSKNPIEEEFEDARLGEDAEETNMLFGRILDFLSDWNWNVDERLDIADPKNLSPAVLGHIFERTVNQKEKGAYYTPEEVTTYMSRQAIHPCLVDKLNEAVDADYEDIDDVFGLAETEIRGKADEAIADGGMVTQQAPIDGVITDHVETLYHNILKESKVLDPAVGSGAFLLAAQEVLLDIYMQCIEHFQRLEEENRAYELRGETLDELEEIESKKVSTTLYAKQEIILNNLYGVDIDEGAVEICKLRLWLSMVADIEGAPDEIKPLPNIDFNIRSGDSLIGFESTEVVVDGQRLLITEMLKDNLGDYIQNIDEYRMAEEDISDLRGELDTLHDEMQAQLDEWFAGLPDITAEDDISGPDELQSIISAAHGDITLKLKFTDSIDDDLDQRLNDLGFRTWKKAANLEMDNNDVLAGRPEQIFEAVSNDQLTRSFVERGLLKEDIEQMNVFHWVMEFPDAYVDLKDGSIVHRDDPGFDVVLENPPYVRVQTIDAMQRDMYKDQHDTVSGKCDLYIPFIERSFDLLSEKGRTSIITSNLFMKTEYGESLRQYLPENYGLEQIFDFTAYSVFEDVTIYSTILLGSQDVGTPIDCISVRSEEAVQEVKSTSYNWSGSEDIVEFTLSADTLGADRWLILTKEERSAREKIEENSDTTLADENLFTVGSPLITGQKKTLQADIAAERGDKYEIENNRISGTVKPGIWKRIINPEDIERWKVSTPEAVTFFPYKTINGEYELLNEETFETEYESTYRMLNDYKDDLLSRKDSRRTWRQLGRPWYSLVRIGSPDYFERDKIVTDIVVDEPHFCIDTNGYLFANGFLHGITPHETDPYYLIGLLNTQALFSYLKPICPPKNSGYMKMEVDQLKQAPVYLPTIQEEICADIRELLEEQEDDFGELYQRICSESVGNTVSSSENTKTIAANIIREVSKKVSEEYDSLSANEIEQLEKLNNYLAGVVFDLAESELRALSHL